ncbi:MAG TPA: hypothetical protein VEA79_13320 [Phenylobacterium sp.]|nr:hypothetical protein [Phenylobacterium sp.]
MRLHPNHFHGAAIVTVAGLITGLGLKPAYREPDPKPAPPAAEAPPPQIAYNGPTPWWVIGSDAFHGRPQPQLTLARAEAPRQDEAAPLEVRPAALVVPDPWEAPRQFAYREAAPRQPAEPRPEEGYGEWRQDAEGVYFVPEEEAYPPEPAYDYDPYA